MANKKKREVREKKDYTMTAAVVFVILVVAFGFYALSGKKETNLLENKIVVDMNVTCEKVWKGVEAFAKLYNVNTTTIPTERIVIAECKTLCQDINSTYDTYKCTSDDKFLCYCNKK